ncbi:MAG: thioredoxin domain-containing protein [Vicinamibacteria bacterium]|jgi:protein-disulfide isomerase|nr:thioredoxin domain-containing protein [Vicinamibacteria bacterium]
MTGSKTDTAPSFHPTAPSLASLVALAAGAALWFAFLWFELVLARSGGSAFCDVNAATSCTAAWDSTFAHRVHQITGLPLAAWGLVWSMAAFVMPLLALLRQAEGRHQPALVSATRLLAVVGLVAVAVMLIASAVLGVFCVGCFAADMIIAGYGGIALFSWTAAGYPQLPRATMVAALACFAGFLALLYPGLNTPLSVTEAGQAATATATRGSAASAPLGTGDAERDQRLVQLVDSLDPRLKQTLSDALGIYRNSDPVTGPASRQNTSAPVHITEWTDIRCGHCAELQQTLLSLREQTPAGSFTVEARQFPLDGECNSMVQNATDPVRCLAARARICLADHPKSEEFARSLFARQTDLTTSEVYRIAAPYMKEAALQSCVVSRETKARLDEDIAYAAQFASDGTPIVALNGRKGVSFPPFLYALILTRGVADHPAFASLPPPNPQAHLH